MAINLLYEEIKMLAQENNYLKEASKSYYQLSQEDEICIFPSKYQHFKACVLFLPCHLPQSDGSSQIFSSQPSREFLVAQE